MGEVGEKNLSSELWHACAGGLVQLPPVNSKVFYFPQGHAEHTLTTVNFGQFPSMPPLIPCRVVSVKRLAEPETDEVYAKIGLLPIGKNESAFDGSDDDELLGRVGSVSSEKPSFFTKTLTQSDANNGGGFSVPRYCAEAIFPSLDFTADPPVQNVIARDVHGESWKFRHIYRGAPKRHLLTTGWSSFVNQKKLVAGDSIVFLRADNGDLCVGIRRAKRGGGIGGRESSSVRNSGGFASFIQEDEGKVLHRGVGSRNVRAKGKVRPEHVMEAAFLVANCQPFEVVFYPRVGTPEFCVKASSVNAALRIQWCSGMRFKMPFETEDPNRINWFMGTITFVRAADPLLWPNSPWRSLQVTWDEPDSLQLQNVKCVSPWLGELVSNFPVPHMPPLSPRKKMRVPHHLDFPLDGQFPLPSFSGRSLGPSSSLSCLTDNLTAGIQGARHAQIGVPVMDLHLNNKQQMGMLQASYLTPSPPSKFPKSKNRARRDDGEDISCLLSMGNCSQKSEKSDGLKTPCFILFGQPIHTEQQMSNDHYGNSSSGGTPWKSAIYTPNSYQAEMKYEPGFHASELDLDTRRCKVFVESEDVGQTLDLSILSSYEELYERLEFMFRIERLEMLSHLFYCDAAGAVKRVGDEPFSEFIKTAKRLSILMKPNIDSTKRIAGLLATVRGLGSSTSKQAGSLTIYV